jgi:glycosyltransferase involved in cell wall biosynthesis
MAQGIPVVATDVGALPEVIINNEGGYRVDKNDISAYADCIIRLLKDADLRREQGQRGYRRYREFFTPAQMSRKYSDLIKIDKGL